MKTAFVVLAAAVLAAGCAHEQAPGAGAQGQSDQAEAALAKTLGGRVAGPPQECVNLPNLGNHKVYGSTVIVFQEDATDVLYVNRPPAACPGLAFGRALKIRGTTTQLCRGDTVATLEPETGVEYGACTLGTFVPYRRSR